MRIKMEDWIAGGRSAVLGALDEYIREQLVEALKHHLGTTLEAARVKADIYNRYEGAYDEDLPELFKAIDAQLKKVAERINDPESEIIGSIFLNIVEEG